MHMVVKNTQYIFILSPIIPYPYLFWVGEGEEANTPHVFHHHPETPQAIKLKLYDFKIHLEYVRICVSQHTLYICPYIENDKSEGGGQKYILSERSLHWESKNFISEAIGATRKKLLWKKSKM